MPHVTRTRRDGDDEFFVGFQKRTDKVHLAVSESDADQMC